MHAIERLCCKTKIVFDNLPVKLPLFNSVFHRGLTAPDELLVKLVFRYQLFVALDYRQIHSKIYSKHLNCGVSLPCPRA